MVCWYPNISESEKIFSCLAQESEYIEIQFPFSDPIADGSTLELANKIALENGITIENCFHFVEKNINNAPAVKVLIMTYYNIILNYGVEKFIKKAKSIWVYGFIIPDVPFDEADWKEIRFLCKKHNIVFTELVSPATWDARLKKISELNPELIYAISQNMTTGSEANFWNDFISYMKNIRTYFSGKIWVWFGIKTHKDVTQVCKEADFAIIGSQFIKKYDAWWITKLHEYLLSIRKNKK